MSVTHRLCIVGAVSSILLAGSAASAQTDTAPDREGISAGVLLGYGSNGVYKLELGARGGYTLAQKIYIGGTFIYHFGESQTFGSVTQSESLFYVGPEGGYDIAIASVPQLLIRPYLGLGFMSASFSTTGAQPGVIVDANGSTSGLALWPGVTGLYSFTPNISAGVDLRAVFPTFGSDDSAFVFSLTGQYKF